jgi:hypothetical protein
MGWSDSRKARNERGGRNRNAKTCLRHIDARSRRLESANGLQSPYASRIAVKNKTSAIKFFQGEWFAEIAQAIGKNPKRLRDAVLT